MDILTHLLQSSIERGPHADLATWSQLLDPSRCPFSGFVERALWSGFHADRIAYAFVGGYGAALARLVRDLPGRPFPARMSMCATESGGNRPTNIATRLEERDGAFVLDGEKTFSTLASNAQELLVVASRGAGSDGQNRLVLVRVLPSASGLHLTDKAPLPFAPEMPHSVIRLDNVHVEASDVLPGDGYSAYVKPFRTIEDTHVLAATVGYMLGAARAHGFDPSFVTELASTAASLVDLGARDPASAVTHLLLAGTVGHFRRLTAALAPEWTKASEDERARWERDQRILTISDGVGALRTKAAWAALTTDE